jgi:hypothetical protein
VSFSLSVGRGSGSNIAHGQIESLSVLMRPLGGGPETDIPAAVVYTFEDGKMARVEDFRERDRALEAIGLAE